MELSRLPMCIAWAVCWCLPLIGMSQELAGFGTPSGKLPLAGFGDPTSEDLLRRRFPSVAVAANAVDRRYAKRQLDEADENQDGQVTLNEWVIKGQSQESFAEMDLDGNGTVSLYENTLRWTMTRMRRSENKRTLTQRNRSRSLAAVHETPVIAFDPNDKWVELEKQNRQLAEYLVARYDVDDNGVIDRREFVSSRSPYGNLAAADFDHDGQADADEVSKWLMFQVKAKHKTDAGLPIELRHLDADQDGQLTLTEFAQPPTPESLAQFRAMDRNDDGLVTPRECSQDKLVARNQGLISFEQARSGVLLPDEVLISEIQVVDEVTIGNLDVKVELSKDDDTFVDLLLIGPDRQTISLFQGGWAPWPGHVLGSTIFSDQAEPIGQRLDERPNPAMLQPPGVKDPSRESLASFHGVSAKGRWRLVIRNHNDRSGLLRRWALLVSPQASEAMP